MCYVGMYEVEEDKSVGNFVLDLLEDVRIVDVIFDGISDGIVPSYVVDLEVRFARLLQMLILHLLVDLNAQGQLLLLALLLSLVL